jgi:hypothetical protein
VWESQRKYGSTQGSSIPSREASHTSKPRTIAWAVERAIARRISADRARSLDSVVLRIRRGRRTASGLKRDMTRGEMETCAMLAAQVAAV